MIRPKEKAVWHGKYTIIMPVNWSCVSSFASATFYRRMLYHNYASILKLRQQLRIRQVLQADVIPS